MNKKTHILNLGFNNIRSLDNAMFHLECDSVVIDKPVPLKNVERLIIPGLGNFDSSINKIKSNGLFNFLNDFKNTERPILGICLGAHIMMESSEEGKLDGLSWFKGKVNKFKFNNNIKFKIPHMGWNKILDTKNRLFNKIDNDHRFYFAHSYYIKCDTKENVIGTTLYGDEFQSAIQNNNIIGVQFHPEKSYKYGERILKNFLKL